jgi:uncharacterized membrane protein YeaQ/YmgE (transglycosylase-associated protein family)
LGFRVELILWIVIGFITGTVAGAVVRGRSPGGWLGSVLLGMSAGLLGGWLGKVLGLADTLTWLTALGLALCVCIAISFVVRPDRSNSSA